MAEVRWTPQAADDLEAIAEFIAADSPHYAKARDAEPVANRLSCLPILALVSLACTATRQETAPRLPSSLLEAHGSEKSARVHEAIAVMIRGIADDITATRGNYPELEAWQGGELNLHEYGGSLRYSFRHGFGTTVPFKKGYPSTFGEHGCVIGIGASFLADPMIAQRRPERYFVGLKLQVNTTVRAGPVTSPGFVGKMRGIFENHIDSLRELDREFRQTHASTRTLSTPGSAARTSASSMSSSE